MAIDSDKKTQIKAQNRAQNRAKVGTLIFDNTFTEVPVEYFDYSVIFSAKNAVELPENTGMNEHAITLENAKQQPFGPIYSLRLVELKILNTYIKTNLANGFIRFFKFFAGVPIFFDRMPEWSLCLCMDYQDFNNRTIKNQYLLPLIGESLDRLGQAKQFTKLDLTNTYHQMRICKGDKWKTAFRTWYSHFKYQVMFFGLSNAPIIFQEYVNKILAKKLNIFIIIYPDNILIYTKNSGQPYNEAVH